MDIFTIVDKRDRTYQFYMKHIMSSLQWLIKKKLDKDKTLVNHFLQDWRHPINRKYIFCRTYKMIEYYCYLCDKTINRKRNLNHYKSETQKLNEKKVIY